MATNRFGTVDKTKLLISLFHSYNLSHPTHVLRMILQLTKEHVLICNRHDAVSWPHLVVHAMRVLHEGGASPVHGVGGAVHEGC